VIAGGTGGGNGAAQTVRTKEVPSVDMLTGWISAANSMQIEIYSISFIEYSKMKIHSSKKLLSFDMNHQTENELFDRQVRRLAKSVH
jgi:hypothetical protein